MKAIVKRDLLALFGNWSGWLFLAVLSLILGLILFYFRTSFNIFNAGVASFQYYFLLMPYILLPICSVVGMRTFAAERENGGLITLFSLPVSLKNLIYSKFLAVFLSGICLILPLIVYYFIILNLTPDGEGFDLASVLVSVFGLLLLLASFSSLSVLASALAPTQLLAFLLSVAFGGILFFGIQQLVDFNLIGPADDFVSQLGMASHYAGFSRGVLSLADVCYFLGITIAAIAATEFILNKNLTK